MPGTIRNIFATSVSMDSSQLWDRNKIRRSILALGVPLIIGELGSICQQFADTMMVGHHSTEELAAAGFINSIFYFVIFLTLGMSYASTPLIASAFGKKDNVIVIKSLFESLIVNLLVGVFFVIVLLGFLYRLEIFNQPTEIIGYAEKYFRWIIWSVPFMTLFNGLKQYLDAIGRTQISMWVLILSNILNIGLNYCLIFGNCGFSDHGLEGAGISTFVARFFQMVVLSIIVFNTKSVKDIIHSKKIVVVKPTKEGVIHQIRLGLPISGQLGLEIAAFNVCGIFMGWLGVISLAAHQAMFTLSTLCFQVLYGFGSAGSILISQFRGVNQWKNIRRTSHQTWLIGLVSVFILTSVISLFFKDFARIFTNDKDVVDVMWVILPWFIFYQIGDCTQITFANALRGIERTKPLIIIAAVAYLCFCIPLCYLFAFIMHLEAAGVWAGIPIGLSTAGVLFYWQFHKTVKSRI